MRIQLVLILLGLAGCASAQVVTVQSNPPGAELRVDGQLVGKTPATFEDKPSDGHYYKLDFALPGYQPVEKVIKQEEGKGSVACIGVAAGCCPLAQVCLLRSYTLPKPIYVFDLAPASPAILPPGNAPPPNAPPPPPNAPPPPR